MPGASFSLSLSMSNLRIIDIPPLFHLPVSSIRISTVTHAYRRSNPTKTTPVLATSREQGGPYRHWETIASMPIEQQLAATRQQLEKAQPRTARKKTANTPFVSNPTSTNPTHRPRATTTSRAATPAFPDSLVQFLDRGRIIRIHDIPEEISPHPVSWQEDLSVRVFFFAFSILLSVSVFISAKCWHCRRRPTGTDASSRKRGGAACFPTQACPQNPRRQHAQACSQARPR